MNRVIKSFPRALDAVRRVMDKNDGKKADKPWADQTPKHHIKHALEHTKEEWYAEDYDDALDRETGEHSAAHGIARLLMYLEIVLTEKEDQLTEKEDQCRTNTW